MGREIPNTCYDASKTIIAPILQTARVLGQRRKLGKASFSPKRILALSFYLLGAGTPVAGSREASIPLWTPA
jgi:hypothetical protein